MLSAEASTPDRGWNIHANLVGRGLMRGHRRPGDQERGRKPWKTDGEAVLKQTLRLWSNYPSCLTNFHLKRECVWHQEDVCYVPQTGTHLKKKNILAMVFWFKGNIHIITQRLSVYLSDVDTSELCPRKSENLLNRVETEKKSRIPSSSASHHCELLFLFINGTNCSLSSVQSSN